MSQGPNEAGVAAPASPAVRSEPRGGRTKRPSRVTLVFGCFFALWVFLCAEAAVMSQPGDQGGVAWAGYGRMLASRADRERVVDVLKAAFVQGRLTKDEFESGVGRALGSRTYAELAAITAGIPAGPA